MIVRLMVSNDKANVKKVVLRSDTVIGRSSDCNLRIASKEVSRKHCSILLSDRSVRVRDLGSANGTFLNGSQIEANVDVPAPPGSELEVGNVRFVISYDAPVPSELEASTAEVPNAVLAARLARTSRAADPDADDRQRVVPRHDEASAGGESSGAAADPQMDTYRGLPVETLREAPSRDETFNAADPDDEGDCTVDERGDRPVDDDTFALKESDAPDPAEASPEAPALPAADETISMRVEDVPIDTRPEPPVPARESAANEEPRGGWKSVFGLFGGKKGKPAEQTASAVPSITDPEPDATVRLEPAPDRLPDAERNRKTVPEVALPQGDEDPEANTLTLPEIEPVGADADSQNDTFQFAADESPSPHAPDGISAVPDAGDTNLQEFFRHLSKE
jgi:FHA domain